jgi:hypothetical protein
LNQNDIFRRPDTDPAYRTLFETVCLRVVDTAYLSPRSAHAFNELCATIISKRTLSDNQFSLLKRIKFEHDMRRRGFSFDTLAEAERIDTKLNTVFNPIKNGPKS